MNQINKIFILCLCFVVVFSQTKPPKTDVDDSDNKSSTDADTKVKLASIIGSEKQEPNKDAKDEKKVVKRQLMPFGAFDYGDYYEALLDYAAYDYYDWVCTERTCRLCDMLTGSCCDPRRNRNCFLPDSCANNPCLSGGTCVTTRTVDARADFVCMCRAGLTGKYCQLIDEFDPINFIPPVVGPLPPPIPAPLPAPVPPPVPPQPAPVQGYNSGFNPFIRGKRSMSKSLRASNSKLEQLLKSIKKN